LRVKTDEIERSRSSSASTSQRAAAFNVYNTAQLEAHASWIEEVPTIKQGKGLATAMRMFNNWTVFNNCTTPPSFEPSVLDALGLKLPSATLLTKTLLNKNVTNEVCVAPRCSHENSDTPTNP
jgi:hypothetical protein